MSGGRAVTVQALADCRACPRLAAYLDRLREQFPDYHNRPVGPWGSRRARLLVVGLAPGLHGANRTGRPFTGDASGDFLFEALHRAGFASAPRAVGASLRDVRITNAVRCVPPGNRPTGAELRTCAGYLSAELDELWTPHTRRSRGVLALGAIAHRSVAIALGRRLPAFRHGQALNLAPGLLLMDCYHPSRQNTNTRRLTPAMLDAVLARLRRHLYSERP